MEDLWAEKEAERRQVGGTAGSQSQQLCQYLAFFAGSTWLLRLLLHPSGRAQSSKQSSRNTKVPERNGSNDAEARGNVRVCAPAVTKITKYNFAGLTGQSWIALLVTYLLIYALSPASDPRVLTHMERLRTSRGHTSHRPAGGVRLLSGPARLSLRGEFPTDVTADVSSRNTGRFLGRGAKCW